MKFIGAMCVTISNFVAIGQAITEIWRFLNFEDGGRLPSWVCDVSVWTTHETYLMVFITVQIWLESTQYIVSTICKS